MCHRKLHHAQLVEKTKILSSLLANRAETLKERGLENNPKKLMSLYRAKLEEE